MMMPMIMMVMMMAVVMVMIMIMMMPTSTSCAMLMMVIMIVMMVMMRRTLGLESARDIRHHTAKAAGHLGGSRISQNIKCIGRDLAWHMIAAEIEGRLQQPRRIFRFDFDERFRRGFDQNERAIIKLQRIAIIQNGRPFERQRENRTFFALKRRVLALSCLMAKSDHINNLVGLYGRLPDKACRALHKIIPFH